MKYPTLIAKKVCSQVPFSMGISPRVLKSPLAAFNLVYEMEEDSVPFLFLPHLSL